ncbi:hypothetical protein LOAG_06521 [Loa loa]|uniref:Uncharacterized protein n=1 Tax=Loa loa TaxID=7209 RepID=A0A1S0TYI7_LOALO|nr:hypothetical protein LOAG_06521 [Loa loa]EFO21964.2 hypothetical protein LOAG_06521 [Loa loa]
MELKKRNHEVSIFQLLKLPINPANVIGSSVESSSRTLAITADVKPGNEWFATGGADRIVKIWDLASGKLRLSLTGHVSAVRCCKVSRRHSFLFTGGEDKQFSTSKNDSYNALLSSICLKNEGQQRPAVFI